ncbi:hypothetical protein AVEN_259352-1 [Araneus ventricosus]|uniref:Uncharacterized protein n=1 Tax=Araneus ventricosus TaxID=182803 RepID=A0A4Y2DV08_ARAVE|nr:hypothetical protein AVEN_259352-1 [Araneus ventricosus]
MKFPSYFVPILYFKDTVRFLEQTLLSKFSWNRTYYTVAFKSRSCFQPHHDHSTPCLSIPNLSGKTVKNYKNIPTETPFSCYFPSSPPLVAGVVAFLRHGDMLNRLWLISKSTLYVRDMQMGGGGIAGRVEKGREKLNYVRQRAEVGRNSDGDLRHGSFSKSIKFRDGGGGKIRGPKRYLLTVKSRIIKCV